LTVVAKGQDMSIIPQEPAYVKPDCRWGRKLNPTLLLADSSPLYTFAKNFAFTEGSRVSHRRDIASNILANLQVCHEHNALLSVHRDKAKSTRTFISALDYLEKENVISQTMGVKGCHSTLVAPGARMLEILSTIRPAIVTRAVKKPPVKLNIKSEKLNNRGELVPDKEAVKRLPNNPSLKHWQNQIKKINQFLSNFHVTFNPPNGKTGFRIHTDVQRVFTAWKDEEFNYSDGGRLYGQWQSLPSGSVYPPGKIALCRCGLLPEFPSDREIHKVASMLIEKVQEYYSGVDLNYPGGLKLQYYDSLIMLGVVSELMAAGKPALPVHDSAVVMAGDEQSLRDAMKRHYTRVMGGSRLIEIPPIEFSNHPGRRHILINSQPTVELDFGSLHPFMCHALQNRKTPSELYLVGKSDMMRKVYKSVVLHGINCANKSQWHGSICKWIRFGKKSQ
jgi:hypothetical protein